MHKFPINKYKKHSQLPFDKLNDQKFAIYIVDFEWNYLFLNTVACKTLNKSSDELIGKNAFEGIKIDHQYNLFLKNVENGIFSTITTISPITKKRSTIIGYPLEDCYYFAVTVLPDKDDLMNELRNELKKK